MSEVTLSAQGGRTPGSSASRRLRKAGGVPAVVYGKDIDPIHVSVDAHELRVALHTEAGANAVISLEVDGSDALTTMARVIERHPFRNEYRHVDFVTISLTELVSAEVAIHFEGTPAGVIEGGVFSPRRSHVIVEALPTAIPSSIELDVSEVEIGGSLRIEDLPAIEGVTYTEDPDAVVMSVTAPAAEVEEEPDVDIEGMEGEEGDEAADSEDGEESEGDSEETDTQ